MTHIEVKGTDTLSTTLNNKAYTDKIILADFWAERCGPCRMLKPVLEKLATEMDEVILCAINVDDSENAELAQQYNVSGIPHVVFFKNGKMVDTFTGALPEEKIVQKINTHLSDNTERTDDDLPMAA